MRQRSSVIQLRLMLQVSGVKNLFQVVDGYFVHFFASSDMEEIPKDVLLILDVSGSMYGIKLRQMKDAVLGILSDLHEGDRFNILKFSTRISFYKESSVIANTETVREAKQYVKNMTASGGTVFHACNIYGVLFWRRNSLLNSIFFYR